MPAASAAEAAVEAVFREEWGRITASLIAMTGDWDLAALTLRTLTGLTTPEIARAFLRSRPPRSLTRCRPPACCRNG